MISKNLVILSHLIACIIAIPAPFTQRSNRRSLVSSLGDTGGILRDESNNFSSTSYGDNMLGGQNNVFSPVSNVNGIDGLGASNPLRTLIRRTQVVTNEGDTRINRDESGNFYGETLGDSVNQGLGNAISPKSVVGGIAGGVLHRRSQQIGRDGDTKMNRDESGNFYANTLGDSSNQGLGNTISPNSVIGGFANSLLRRSQQIIKDGDTKINRDESANAYMETLGDSVGQGLGNLLSPQSSVGAPNTPLIRRSQQIIKDGDTKINRDESANAYTETLGDSIGQGLGNLLSPQSSVGAPNTPLIRRSQVIENDANVMINRDESANAYAETVGDSANQGQGNKINPQSLIFGPSGRILGRRSQKVKFTGDMTINDDSSLNLASQSVGDSTNAGSGNNVNPQSTVVRNTFPLLKRRNPQDVTTTSNSGIIPGNAQSIIGSVQSAVKNQQGDATSTILGSNNGITLTRREDQYLLTGTRYVSIDESENTYTVTDGDSVNQGVGNILQPITRIAAPSAKVVRRSQVVKNTGQTQINIDESANGYTETLGDSANQGFLNKINPLSVISGPQVGRRDKVLNNMNEVVAIDRSKNHYGVTYGDSVNSGQGNIINPQTLIGGISGVAGLTQATQAPVAAPGPVPESLT